jgi:hypothetical protein
MKQVHDRSAHTEEVPKDAKIDEASLKFVDLFRRIVAESHKERLTHG